MGRSVEFIPDSYRDQQRREYWEDNMETKDEDECLDFEEIICPNCGRHLPDEDMLTEDGCEWCDEDNKE